MHTLSSASLTCIASASAVECTATVAMPSSLHALWIRRAISPLFAIRTLSNIGSLRSRAAGSKRASKPVPPVCCLLPIASFDHDQRLAELDRLAILEQDLGNGPGFGRRDLVHGLHRLDDQQRLALCDTRPDLDERCRAGLG